jgi:DNA repair exonuclease SbcCD ATPase subunit
LSSLFQVRDKLSQAKGKRDLLIDQFNDKVEELNTLDPLVENLTKARWVFTEVSKLTQEKFKDRVEKLVTMAIRSVFDRPFKFVLNFERKHNKLAIQPVVMEGENEYIPKDDMGGGVLDIIGFALRVVLWSLEKPRSRNVMVLDEPAKWTGRLIEKFGQMVKEVSQSLNFQVIMVTHDDELMQVADRAWVVDHNGIYSIVKQVGEDKPKRTLKRIVKR